MRRRPAAIAVAIASVGAALALALTADGQPGSVPGLPSGARPEVPGSARTLVPFGIETTADGFRAWALGQAAARTVVLQRAPNGGWSSTGLPVTGRPVGGSAPQHAGELSADGHGAILLADPDHPGQDAQLLVRAPGGAFTAAPAADAVLQSGERLVPDATLPQARALIAVIGGADAATLVAPTNAEGTATSVLRLDADGWHREALDGAVRPVALAAAGPSRAWLLGTTGDGVVLLHRETPAGGDPRWVPVTPVGDALLAGRPLPAELSTVTVDGPPADPLTATPDGVWLDLRVTPANGSEPVDVTEHLAVADSPPAGDPAATATVTATASATATPSATPSPSPSATPGPVTAATLDGRWCDLSGSLCDHRLGFAFARGTTGYRSVAGPAADGAPFGVREVSAPVDAGVAAGARAREAERQGGYAQLAGDAFALRDGIGEDGTSTTQALAFSPDGTTGFTGGTVAFGAATAARPATVADVPLTSFGDAIVSAAAAPNGDGRVLAISRQGGAMLYTPERGWKYPNTGLMSTLSHGRFVALRAIVWPRPNLLIGVGSAGALVTATNDPVPFDLTLEGLLDDTGRQVSRYDDLPVEATLLAIACTTADPLDCTAVGRDGLIVRGDGKRWKVEHLPAETPSATDLTSVAYDGRTPLVATTDGLYAGDDDGHWTRDDALRAQLEAAGRPAAVERVATEPGGGTVVDGSFERDAPTAPWRATSAPLDLHPVAIAAIRDGDSVRTIVSAAPAAVPLPTPVTPDDGDTGPPEEDDGGPRHDPVPFDVSPVDTVVLRETADGWVDLDGTSYQPSGGRDLPRTTPNTRVLVLDPAGTGVALGGIGGTQPDPRAADPVSPTSSTRRLEHGGAPATPPAVAPAETGTLPGDTVRLAVGGHAACLDRCTGGGGQGVTPDVHLDAAVTRVKAMVAAGNGPSALLFGGGRASRGGEPLDEAGARRYRQLTQGAGVPTYVLPGPGDLPGGGDAAFARAFADAAAPEGTGAVPDGVDVGAITQPEAAGGRRFFAFDVRAAAGGVRVVAIDNAAGALAGGPDGPQAQWLRSVMDGARSLGVPVVVVGSVSLDGAQLMPRADDADAEISLLAGHASAYVATAGVDDPQDPHFGGVLSRTDVMRPDAGAPLAIFQSSTLGYSAPRSLTQYDDDIDEAEYTRQTSAALLMLDVAVGKFDARTGVAPVTAVSEPLVNAVALDTTVQAIPVGFAQPLGVAATDPAPMRFLWREGEGAPLQPAGAYNGVFLPLEQCVLWSSTCDSAIPTDLAFSSSNPRVARFVAARRSLQNGGARLPEVVLDADGHVVDDARGVFCPLAAGSTDVTVTTAGRSVTASVQVVKTSLLSGLPSQVHVTPIPPGTCGFPDFTVIKPPEKTAAAAPETPAAPQRPGPAAILPPQVVQPHHPVVVHQSPHPAPAVPPPAPAAPAPAPPVQSPPPVTQSPTDPHARPPVAPAAKAPAPPAPPAPPSGLAVQSAAATQAQPFQATQVQEQRRREHAFEADSAAVAYAHPPSPLPWELLGGGAVLALVIAGGSLAGHARRRALAPALASATAGPADIRRRRTR
ncbi:hypothetical protein OM076_06940 [Solirubrobacter ginsenosidimutans]|uniref:Uncharacterized protein n=1 Tax=Solirubrobacter ginsenosidimutans TaxID=490573 RepID=A0A9X3RYR5_9ACTN|nr:hypothetical protein [Solirubrobacter ginsenosidimutans]MDA0159990.1 hypothetical protein [Solirubrobacter ginsenosidimutans]